MMTFSAVSSIRKTILFLILCVSLMATVSVTIAQDGTAFTLSDQSLSLAIPEGWTVEEAVPGSVVMVKDDVYVGITLVPANMLAEYGFSLGKTGEEALQFVLESGLYAPYEADTQIGEIQSIELANTASAAQFSIVTPDKEGALIASIYADEVVAYISVAVPVGELSNYEASIYAIAESITVLVTADELQTLIMS